MSELEEGEEQDDGGGNCGSVGHHVSKRSRRNKGIVVLFDPEARKDFVTGFHKRKKKRRKFAEKQKKIKEREKHLQARKERRLALNHALGGPMSDQVEGHVKDTNVEILVDQHQLDQGRLHIGTVTYEDENTMTVVNTRPIDLNDDLGNPCIYKSPQCRGGNDPSKKVSRKRSVSKAPKGKWKVQ